MGWPASSSQTREPAKILLQSRVQFVGNAALGCGRHWSAMPWHLGKRARAGPTLAKEQGHESLCRAATRPSSEGPILPFTAACGEIHGLSPRAQFRSPDSAARTRPGRPPCSMVRSGQWRLCRVATSEVEKNTYLLQEIHRHATRFGRVECAGGRSDPAEAGAVLRRIDSTPVALSSSMTATRRQPLRRPPCSVWLDRPDAIQAALASSMSCVPSTLASVCAGATRLACNSPSTDKSTRTPAATKQTMAVIPAIVATWLKA
jgi:hypothetical protein